MLSRGYRRATKGFIIAGATSTPRDIGDESYQIYHKFHGEVVVAVCEDRVAGINELLRLDPKIEMIILDDAFQHRYVKATVSVVITEYNRPLSEDHMLPYGHLREPARGINRADIVIVSKCPANMTPWDYRETVNRYNLFPSQHLFFSHYAYQPLCPVFPDIATSVPYLDWLTSADSILAVAGIGNPRVFKRDMAVRYNVVDTLFFGDHHRYTTDDITAMERLVDRHPRAIILMTEKDAVKLRRCKRFSERLRRALYYQPVEMEIIEGSDADFTGSLTADIEYSDRE